MNSRQLWNTHKRNKFLRAEASRDNLKFSLRNHVYMDFQEVFSIADAIFFRRNTRKTGNNAGKMSVVFLSMAQFERFTDLNLFKYAFNVIQNWEMVTLQCYSMVLIFC